MLHNDPQPNKLCDWACIQSAFSVEGDSVICLTIFDDMLVIDVTCYSIHLSVNSVFHVGIITKCFLVSLFKINILTVATYFIIS